MSSQRAKRRDIPWGWIGLISFIAVIGIGSAVNGAEAEPEDMTDQAEMNCQDWVSERLKAPATADFTTTDSTGYDQGPWTFSGTVDAENSFGAKIRNQWECNISLEDGLFTGESRAY